jgi:hypothetical protein
MRWTAPVVVLLLSSFHCWAQDTTLADAKKDLSAAKDKLEKAVVFREEAEGGGAFLKSEYQALEHRQHLERKAERKGLSKDEAAQFDIANRLEKYSEQTESEAFEMLAAYVGFVKVYREYEAVIKDNPAVADKVGKIIAELDTLIDRHGRALRIKSLKLLYEEDPVGKVGAFDLHGVKRTVRIDGKDVEVLKLRTLKERSVLIMRDAAKQRDGFIVAEIVGKDTYTTEAGDEILGILLQAY